MSTDRPTDERSWLPPSNSVNSSTPENPPSDENEEYDERVARQAAERVAKFREEYPHLADKPLTKTSGRDLRSELVEEEYIEEHVEPDGEHGSGFTVHRLDSACPVTWAEAMFEFLTSRQKYDDGLQGRFSDSSGDDFLVDFNDCWTPAYADKQRARNAGAQRQLMGGRYPESEDSQRACETVDGEWSGDTGTIMLTRTGSAVPDGEHLPPLDHDDEVARAWSLGGVYDTVRNVCEHHLGLESDEWGYVRSDDVHGMGNDSGPNACYTHSHEPIYIDLGATGLRDELGSDEEIKAVLRSKFYKAIEKHVEACDVAKPEAHTPEKAVDVHLDLKEPAAYASAYALPCDDKEMMDRPVEYQAWATVKWASNRQRIARSQNFTQAAKADMCLQDPDVEHGGTVCRQNGETVCAHCNSPVKVADTLVENRVDPVVDDVPPDLAGSGSGDGDVPEYVGAWGGCDSVAVYEPVRVRECDHDEPNMCPLCVDCGVGVAHPEPDPGAVANSYSVFVDVGDLGCGSVDRYKAQNPSAGVAEIAGALCMSPGRVRDVLGVGGGCEGCRVCQDEIEEGAFAVSGEVAIPEGADDPLDVEPVVVGASGDDADVVKPDTLLEEEYTLDAIVAPDGGEEEVTCPGAGGVDTTATYLPEQELVRETSLDSGGKIVVQRAGGRECCTYNPEIAACWLVEDGFRVPHVAEEMFRFADH
jgi:hypothetical protein